MIQVETATVYRGGGRRWFSRQAAINAEARALHRARYRPRCECDPPQPEFGDGGSPCHFHTSEFYTRFVRRVTRLLAAAPAQGDRHD